MALVELESGHIKANVETHVLRITLDRANKRNALNTAMYADIQRCVDYARDQDDVHALLIDAEGEMFCAGNDISDFANADPHAEGGVTSGPAMTLIKTLHVLDKPVVVAVQGQATGIGTTLLLHCDLVVAGNSARFYTAFIDLAIVPEAASSQLLPALIGRQNAARLLLAGDTLSAEQAERMGLIAYRTDDAQLDEQATALAHRLAAKPPEAMRLSKQLMRSGMASNDIRGQIEREGEVFAERLFSDEFREIINRFLKR